MRVSLVDRDDHNIHAGTAMEEGFRIIFSVTGERQGSRFTFHAWNQPNQPNHGLFHSQSRSLSLHSWDPPDGAEQLSATLASY